MKCLRVAPHVHSDWSYDGNWPLDEIARVFSKCYDAVLTTEHDRGFTEERWQEYRRACERTSTPRFVFVPGLEYSDPKNRVHILVWGINEFLGENRETLGLLRDVASLGGIAVLAHPERMSAWQYVVDDWIGLLDGAEIWNRKTDGWAPSRHAKEIISGTSLTAFVGLDFHKMRQFFPLAMNITVETDDVCGVLTALRTRRYTAVAFGVAAERFLLGPQHLLAQSAERARRLVRKLSIHSK